MSSVTSIAGSAVGHTFTGTSRFASGGTFTNNVVNRPTPFLFRDGGSLQHGLMGEAGPEAVMPLQRQGGNLGVAALDSRGRQIGVMLLARGPGGRLGAVATDQSGQHARFAVGGWFGAGAGAWVSPARFAAGGAFDGVGPRLARAMGPAASGNGGGDGAITVTIAPNVSVNIDARTDKDQVVQLVQKGVQFAVKQAQAEMLDMMRRNRAAFRS